MTSSIPVSAALLRITSEWARSPSALAKGFETGEAHTRKASNGPTGLARSLSRFIQRGTRKHPSSPDKKASRERKRSWAGSGMPAALWKHYTEGERAVLCVVGDEVMRNGYCDLPLDRIAAVAGVSRTTCQNALRKARQADMRHVTVEERPRVGQKNLTNIVRIISKTWLEFLKRRIGFKRMSPTVDKNNNLSSLGSAERSQGAYERERAGKMAAECGPTHARLHDGKQEPLRRGCEWRETGTFEPLKQADRESRGVVQNFAGHMGTGAGPYAR